MSPSSILATPVMPAAQQLQSLGAELKNAASRQSKEAAVKFESLFVSQLLKSMRDTIGGDGLFGGDASDTYGGLFDLFMGQHLAESGGFGIGDLVTDYLEQAKTEKIETE